ncbi:MAG: AtpZ/AtpI family protein [Candidatus Hydrogenedentota bacterium]|nr:MAG: AtpZ/AtpI family protein [Candidatus Hydrogenedentota bacterium]
MSLRPRGHGKLNNTMLTEKEKQDLEKRIEKLEKDQEAFEKQRKPDRKKIPSAFRYAHLGLEFAGIFIFFVYGSSWLQKKLQLGSWFFLLGVIIGFAAAMVRLLQAVQEMDR